MRLLLERFTCDNADCDNKLDMPYLGQGRANKLPEGWIGTAGTKWGGIYCGLSCLEAEIRRSLKTNQSAELVSDKNSSTE